MSQATIGNLNVKLGIDTAEFGNGLRKAQSSLGNFAGAMKGLAVGAAAGAAAALGGLAVAINSSLGRMDELGKAAQKIGIPVDEFSKLEYAAKLSDISLEQLTGTLAKFSKNLAEVGAGGQNDASAALAALGVSATDAQGRLRPTSAIIADVAAAFAAMKDGADKTALAMALFGKSGAEMIPLLNGGREAIANAGAELERFGGVVTPEAAANAEAFNDNLTRMQEAAGGMATVLASKLSPFMAEITNNFLDWVQSGGAAEQVWNAINWVIQQGLQFMYETIAVWKSFTAYVYGAGKALSALASADLDGASAALSQAGKDSEQAWADAEKQFLHYRAILNGTKSEPGKGNLPANIDPQSFGLRKQVTLPPAKPTTKPEKVVPPGTIDDIYGAGAAVQSLQTSFEEAAPQATLFSESLLQIGDSIATGLSDAITGLISGTMSAKDAFANMAQSILRSISDIAAEILRSGIIKLIGSIAGAALGGGGAGFNLGGMTFGGLYANGGTLGAGRWGIAGEAGPEIIHGPARITPMDKLGGQSAPLNVTVINNTAAKVNTQKALDGSVRITIEDVVAEALARGGNKIDAAMTRGYGLRRSGR